MINKNENFNTMNFFIKDFILKDEQSIKKTWKKNNGPLVSICCVTYNHEEYIEDALKSFLMQETDFSYEILIHDDASTDSTQKIIKKYEKLYPDIIKPIYQTENQHSKNIRVTPTFNFTRIKGKYVAICEGDDYWIDSKKLQKQIDLMEKNPEYNLCFHKAIMIYMKNNSTIKTLGQYSDKDESIKFEDMLARSMGMIATASCVLRATVIDKIIGFINNNPYLKQSDTIMQYISSYPNGALYIDEHMSVYRFQVNNSWTEKFTSDLTFRREVHISKIKTNLALNAYFNNRYSHIIDTLNFDHSFRLMNHIEKPDDDLSLKLNKIIHNFLSAHMKTLDLENSNIVLYSASTNTEWLLNKFTGIKFYSILDADINLHDTICYGHTVQHPSKFTHKKQPILITIWDRKHLVAKTLTKKYNIDEKYIIDFPLNEDFIQKLLDITKVHDK